MAEGKAAAGSGGIGFGGALTVLFVGLKLTHYIDWSWGWVLSPIWIPLALIAALLFAGLLLWATGAVIAKVAS